MDVELHHDEVSIQPIDLVFATSLTGLTSMYNEDTLFFDSLPYLYGLEVVKSDGEITEAYLDDEPISKSVAKELLDHINDSLNTAAFYFDEQLLYVTLNPNLPTAIRERLIERITEMHDALVQMVRDAAENERMYGHGDDF